MGLTTTIRSLFRKGELRMAQSSQATSWYGQIGDLPSPRQLVRGVPTPNTPHHNNRKGDSRMIEFFIGTILGGFLGVVIMCMVQINKTGGRDRDE